MEMSEIMSRIMSFVKNIIIMLLILHELLAKSIYLSILNLPKFLFCLFYSIQVHKVTDVQGSFKYREGSASRLNPHLPPHQLGELRDIDSKKNKKSSSLTNKWASLQNVLWIQKWAQSHRDLDLLCRMWDMTPPKMEWRQWLSWMMVAVFRVCLGGYRVRLICSCSYLCCKVNSGCFQI